jgi:thiamine biosynthesis lipoprotein
MDSFLINAGGNVLVGKHYSNEAYKIGIEDPTSDSADIFMKVKANEKAVVTSGSYQRFYEIDGKRYSHIINPKTKYPADDFLSVTVITSDSALGDILSTVLYLLPLEDGMNLVNEMDDVEAVWYISEEEQVESQHFSDYSYE